MNARRLPHLVVLTLLMASPVRAQEGSDAADLALELEKAKRKVVAQEEYELRYKFTSGEAVRWKVVHLATTETKIQGNTQSARSRSASTKVWRVIQQDDDGKVKLTHSVENVDMWQKLSDRPEVRYNSETDEDPPPEYQQVAKTLARPLTTVTIRADGTVVDRESDSPHFKFGIGNMVMRLPPQPVRLGSRWFEPSEIQVRMPDGRMKRIKTRKLYTLEKVHAGVATISVKTEVLTPVNDPRVKSGLIQQLTKGTVKFDVDAGRIISKQLDWDETVIGFNGADSMLKYLARFTEELLPNTNTARRAADIRSNR